MYDCGSCLCVQLTDEQIEEILNNKTEINERIYNRPVSTITENGKKINYFEFTYSTKNDDCNKALKRIFPMIDMNKIDEVIDNMPIISDIRKKFYKELVNGRYELILQKTYNKII